MTAPKPIRSSGAPGAPGAYEPPSPVEKLEEGAADASLAAGEALRAVEVAGVVLLGLLVCPPLAILGLIAAVLTTPYLLVHHFRSHDRRHASLLAHRLRRAGRALVDLLPHRIVADARKVDARR